MASCPNNCIAGEIRVENGRDEAGIPIIYTTRCPCGGNGFPDPDPSPLGSPN